MLFNKKKNNVIVSLDLGQLCDRKISSQNIAKIFTEEPDNASFRVPNKYFAIQYFKANFTNVNIIQLDVRRRTYIIKF